MIAGVVCLSPLAGELLLAQPPAAPPPAAAQPAVPRGMAPVINRREPAKDSPPAPRSSAAVYSSAAADAKEKGGLWTPMFGILDPILEYSKVPFQPWAKALYDARQADELEPHARCHPSGVARQFMTPYGVEFVEMPELQRIYIFDEGGPHTFRIVYMDGRTHPAKVVPTALRPFDRLVGRRHAGRRHDRVQRAILARPARAPAHRSAAHDRTLYAHQRRGMKYEVTVDDPGAYTAPWTGWFYMSFKPGQELWEYVCQQANYAHELMVGSFDTMDRTTTIVP